MLPHALQIAIVHFVCCSCHMCLISSFRNQTEIRVSGSVVFTCSVLMVFVFTPTVVANSAKSVKVVGCSGKNAPMMCKPNRHQTDTQTECSDGRLSENGTLLNMIGRYKNDYNDDDDNCAPGMWGRKNLTPVQQSVTSHSGTGEQDSTNVVIKK